MKAVLYILIAAKLLLAVIRVDAQVPIQHVANGSFEINAFSNTNRPILNWEPLAQIPQWMNQNSSWIPIAGVAPPASVPISSADLHENADQNLANFVGQIQTNFHQLGCHPTTCWNGPNRLNNNDFDAWQGNYFVGMGGCEGIQQTLGIPVQPNSIITITLRYSGRCQQVYNSPLIVGLSSGITHRNCVLNSQNDISARVNTNGAGICQWNVFTTSFIYRGNVPLTEFYVYVPRCTGQDGGRGFRSNCYYYIDGLAVTTTPINQTEFIESCPTCSRCAKSLELDQADPSFSIPNAVGPNNPFHVRHLVNVHILNLNIFDRWGESIFSEWYGDHNCWPSDPDNLPGYYPGWDFKKPNGQPYPEGTYVINATAWKCCPNGNEPGKTEYVGTITKLDNSPDYTYRRYDYSWYPSECCLNNIAIVDRVLQGRPSYVVNEWIRVISCSVSQINFPSSVYLQAPEITLSGETIVYDPNNPQYPAIIDGGFTAIAAPCTPTPAEYGCTPKPSVSGKTDGGDYRRITSDSYWATAPPQIPVYNIHEGDDEDYSPLLDERGQLQQIRVYPNPADQQLTVSLAPDDELNINDYTLAIFDSQGRRVPPFGQRVSDPKTVTLDVSTLASGFYILQISRGELQHHFRFVKP